MTTTSDVVLLAIIAGCQLIVMALMTASLQAWKDQRDATQKRRDKEEDARLRSQEKAEDYARQDAVAEKAEAALKRAADAAELLVTNQTETAARLERTQAETRERTDEVARVAAEADARVQKQLIAIDDQGKKIHILVNSDMTAARTNERDQTRLTLLALKRVQSLSLQLGLPPDAEEAQAIGDAEARITELDRILADRHAAQLAVEAETKAEASRQAQGNVVPRE